MMFTKRIGRAVVLAVLFGIVLYAIVYFMASNSEAFEFAERKIRSSSAVKERLWDIKSVRPAVLGPYAQKTVNSDKWVSMAIYISGTGKSIELEVKMKKVNGAWMVERAESDGRGFNLE